MWAGWGVPEAPCTSVWVEFTEQLMGRIEMCNPSCSNQRPLDERGLFHVRIHQRYIVAHPWAGGRVCNVGENRP